MVEPQFCITTLRGPTLIAHINCLLENHFPSSRDCLFERQILLWGNESFAHRQLSHFSLATRFANDSSSFVPVWFQFGFLCSIDEAHDYAPHIRFNIDNQMWFACDLFGVKWGNSTHTHSNCNWSIIEIWQAQLLISDWKTTKSKYEKGEKKVSLVFFRSVFFLPAVTCRLCRKWPLEIRLV